MIELKIIFSFSSIIIHYYMEDTEAHHDVITPLSGGKAVYMYICTCIHTYVSMYKLRVTPLKAEI